MTTPRGTILFGETQYGFVYGAATVERVLSHKGYVIVDVTTPKQKIQITVTPKGLIRVYTLKGKAKLFEGIFG